MNFLRLTVYILILTECYQSSEAMGELEAVVFYHVVSQFYSSFMLINDVGYCTSKVKESVAGW